MAKYLIPFLIFIGVLSTRSYAQYQVLGDASALGPDTFLLTPDMAWQSGAVWYKLKHNFNTPFSITGSMFFGDLDDGADGIVFVIQNKCLVEGNNGGGIGYQNFPGYSLGVEFDTYQNTGSPWNDPPYDHVAIVQDGNIDHATNLAGPVQMDATLANVEDNNWHPFQIDYDPSTTTLNVYFGGNLRLSHSVDISNTILRGDNFAYWGFTSSTGGSWADNSVAISSFTTLRLEDTTFCAGTKTVNLAPLNPQNVAFNRTATASSVEGPFIESNAFDSNLGTRWSSSFSDPQWISVDLGQPTDIDSVILYWEGAYGSEYMIQTSTDNTTWTDQFHEFTGNGGTDQIYFTANNVRYVRMFGLQRATPYGYSLFEFEVYSTPQYAWAPNDGSISDTASANPTFSPTATTNYTLTIPDPCLGETQLNFTIIVDCNPLPIELLSFDGMAVHRQIDLFWVTLNEVNNDYFIVERSLDASNWSKIGQVDGAGTYNGQLNYQLVDDNINWSVAGYYYRLVQVDFNASSSTSDIIYIPLEHDFGNQLIIFPSPIGKDDQLHLAGIKEGTDTFSMYDISGKSVLTEVSVTKISKDQLLVDVSQLAPGYYRVSYGKQKGKFMKL
ncbi:F5/8 type C domain protein [compost metagenome]